MANDGAFVLPAGVQLSMEGDSLSIVNEGDIIIKGAPASDLGVLTSKAGDVVLAPPERVSLKTVSAPAGKVTIQGKVVCTSIEAREIAFEGGILKAKVLKGSETISLAGTKIEATVVVAPSVSVAATLKGRATAIESSQELGPHKLKGGFSLAEFVDMMPGSEELLEEHGIEVPADDEDDEDDEDDDAPTPEPAAEEAAPAEPAAQPALSVPEDLHNKVVEALDKIVAAYADSEQPPPITLLKSKVDDGDYAGLKLQINTIWSDLLKFHQQSGLYISNTVTQMFQTIQVLMRKVD